MRRRRLHRGRPHPRRYRTDLNSTSSPDARRAATESWLAAFESDR